MKKLDRVLQRWRIQEAVRFIEPGQRVLDIGAADGALCRYLPPNTTYLGIDPLVEAAALLGPAAKLIGGVFPDSLPRNTQFDVICLLAVLEHVPTNEQHSLAEACASCLRPGGLLVVTVPSPHVDRVLAMLRLLRAIDGMSLEQHYGFDVAQTPAIFERASLVLTNHRHFQLGLNNLFVFQRPRLNA